MIRQRNILRVRNAHGQFLNKIFFSYVFESYCKNKKEKKEVFKRWNNEWTDYCFKYRNNTLSKPMPVAFSNITKDEEKIRQVVQHLGLTDNRTIIQKLITWLGL